ncbi:MAG: RND transporter [Rhodobacterales bacterium]
MMKIIDRISWPVVILLCLTLGVSPFFPEPHVWEKLKMLAAGQLTRLIDIFDLFFHASPFAVALLKAVRMRRQA